MDWYDQTELDDACSHYTHCVDSEQNGNCDSCDTIEGRWVEAVNIYASTCDWCAELEMHELQAYDPETQLGYCQRCLSKLPTEIRQRLIQPFNSDPQDL